MHRDHRIARLTVQIPPHKYTGGLYHALDTILESSDYLLTVIRGAQVELIELIFNVIEPSRNRLNNPLQLLSLLLTPRQIDHAVELGRVQCTIDLAQALVLAVKEHVHTVEFRNLRGFNIGKCSLGCRLELIAAKVASACDQVLDTYQLVLHRFIVSAGRADAKCQSPKHLDQLHRNRLVLLDRSVDLRGGFRKRRQDRRTEHQCLFGGLSQLRKSLLLKPQQILIALDSGQTFFDDGTFHHALFKFQFGHQSSLKDLS